MPDVSVGVDVDVHVRVVVIGLLFLLAALPRCVSLVRCFFHGFKCTGCVKAPLPAESHAAKRTHFLPAELKGMRKR